MIGCPRPSIPEDESQAQAREEPTAVPQTSSDAAANQASSSSVPRTRVTHSPVTRSEDDVPELRAVAARLADALLQADLELLEQLVHPDRREVSVREFGEAAESLAHLGQGFAHRQLIALDDSQALYVVFVPGLGHYLVEFVSSGDTWWLSLWIPF